jgi:hypothetical protein
MLFFLLIYIYNLLNRIRVLSKYNDDTVLIGAIGECRFTLGYIPIGKSSGHCRLSPLNNRWYIGENSNQFVYMIRIPVSVLSGLGMYYVIDEWYF